MSSGRDEFCCNIKCLVKDVAVPRHAERSCANGGCSHHGFEIRGELSSSLGSPPTFSTSQPARCCRFKFSENLPALRDRARAWFPVHIIDALTKLYLAFATAPGAEANGLLCYFRIDQPGTVPARSA